MQDTQGGLASGFADKIASLADIDGDGVADLVAYEPNFGNGYCEILLSAGASVNTVGFVDCGSGMADIVSLPDLDGDNVADAVLLDSDGVSGGATGVMRFFRWDPTAFGVGQIEYLFNVDASDLSVSELLGPIAFLREDSGVFTIAIRAIQSSSLDSVVVTFEVDAGANPPYQVTKLTDIEEPGTWSSSGTFGESIASAGTQTPAVFIGAPGVPAYGKVGKFRASDGQFLKEYKASPSGQLQQEEFGSHVASADLDLDGDLELIVRTDQPTSAAVADKILLFDQFGSGQPYFNHLVLVDGVNGFLEPAPWGLRVGEDFDLDGVPDYLAVSGSAYGASVYSGVDSELLYTGRFPAAGTLHACALLGAEQKVCFGHPDYMSGSGRIVIEELLPYIELSNAQLSASNPADIDIDLDFPVADAGISYRVLISTGRSPYAQLGGIDLPIEGAGGWYWDSVNGTLPSFCTDFTGTLDGSGDGQALIDASGIPAGALNALIGSEFSMCAISGTGTSVTRSSFRRTIQVTS